MKNKKIALSLAAAGIPTLALMVLALPALAGQIDFKPGFLRHGPNPEMQQQMQAIRTAVENNDYEAFKALEAKMPFKGVAVDELAFAKIVEANKLRKSGDIKGAQKLLEEAGLKPKHHGDKMKHSRPFRNLTDDQKSQLEEARKLFNSGDKEGAKAIFEEIRANK